MKNCRCLWLVAMLVCLSATAFAQAPNGTGRYYESANNTKGRELKTALFQIIKKQSNSVQETQKILKN